MASRNKCHYGEKTKAEKNTQDEKQSQRKTTGEKNSRIEK